MPCQYTTILNSAFMTKLMDDKIYTMDLWLFLLFWLDDLTKGGTLGALRGVITLTVCGWA